MLLVDLTKPSLALDIEFPHKPCELSPIFDNVGGNERPALSFISPVFLRHGDVSRLVQAVAAVSDSVSECLELVLVYERSEHESVLASLQGSLASPSGRVLVTLVVLRGSPGQHPSSVIGALHASGDCLAILDSDDFDLVSLMVERVSSLRALQLDFEMYQPRRPSRSPWRQLSTRVANVLGRAWTGAPRGFEFSSKVLLSRDFIEAIRPDLQPLREMQAGWMFNFTDLYAGHPYDQTNLVTRSRTTYDRWKLASQFARLLRLSLAKHFDGVVGGVILLALASLALNFGNFLTGVLRGSSEIDLFTQTGTNVSIAAILVAIALLIWTGREQVGQRLNISHKSLVHQIETQPLEDYRSLRFGNA